MPEIIILKRGEMAALDAVQPGFAHGYGLFETIKLAHGRLCFWEAHCTRLSRSAAALGLKLAHDPAAILGAVRKLADTEGLSNGTIKLSLLKEAAGARLYVYTRPGLPLPKQVCLQLDTTCPLNEHSILAGHKTHNYMENMLLLERARAGGYADVIRVNTSGALAETTMGNLFYLKDGAWFTPSVSTGILPGIVRQALLETLKVTACEEPAGILRHVEEVFITNSSAGVLPVDRIAGQDGEVIHQCRSHQQANAVARTFARIEQEHSRKI